MIVLSYKKSDYPNMRIAVNMFGKPKHVFLSRNLVSGLVLRFEVLFFRERMPDYLLVTQTDCDVYERFIAQIIPNRASEISRHIMSIPTAKRMTKLRSLAFNFQKNKALLSRVKAGIIKVTTLMNMHTTELASSQVKENRKRKHEAFMKSRIKESE